MKESIFKNKRNIPWLALIAVFAWGCAYPLIKIGLEQFGIDSLDTGSKTLFAGIRFLLAGFIVLTMARCRHCSFKPNKNTDWWWIILFAFINTAMHYFCFYIGVSNSKGSRASVLNSLGTFILVILACVVFPDERFTTKKIVGCLLGFGGLLIVNLNGERTESFTFMGDGMIILNACCSAFGGILTRVVSKKANILFVTGMGLSLGGTMLITGGLFMYGSIPQVTLHGIFILFLLVLISTIGFSIYNHLLRYHPVGSVAIYNSLIPVFGIMMSCIVLGEDFSLRYICSGLIVASGVYVVNRDKRIAS